MDSTMFAMLAFALICVTIGLARLVSELRYRRSYERVRLMRERALLYRAAHRLHVVRNASAKMRREAFDEF